MVVLATPEESPHPPTIQQPVQQVQMTETDAQIVHFLVAPIQASDEDLDHLWFYIHGEEDLPKAGWNPDHL